MEKFSELYVIKDDYLATKSKTPKALDPTKINLATPDERLAYYRYLHAINIFREEKNPASALEAFIAINEAGFYPPDDLLDWLSECFQKWFLGGGKTNLEKILKLSMIASGNTPAIESFRKHQRNLHIINEITHLMEAFKLSQEDAAEMVADRMEADNDPLKISFSTIRRDILPIMVSDKKKKGWSVAILDDESKIKLLKKYPYANKFKKNINALLRGAKK